MAWRRKGHPLLGYRADPKVISFCVVQNYVANKGDMVSDRPTTLSAKRC